MTDEDKIKQMLKSDDFRALGFEMAIKYLGWCEFECVSFIIEWIVDFDFKALKKIEFTCLGFDFVIEKETIETYVIESSISIFSNNSENNRLYQNCYFKPNNKNDIIRIKAEIKNEIFHFLRYHI